MYAVLYILIASDLLFLMSHTCIMLCVRQAWGRVHGRSGVCHVTVEGLVVVVRGGVGVEGWGLYSFTSSDCAEIQTCRISCIPGRTVRWTLPKGNGVLDVRPSCAQHCMFSSARKMKMFVIT